MKKGLPIIASIALMSFIPAALAGSTVEMRLVNIKPEKASIGHVTLLDSRYGLLILPHLRGLTPGLHGFHIHAHPSCEQAAMAAGGHFDPHKTDQHLGPYNSKGHLGDLPVLYVKADGTANTPLLAPRLTVKQIQNKALMLHAGGDNYADNPPMGGGASRLACGVIPTP